MHNFYDMDDAINELSLIARVVPISPGIAKAMGATYCCTFLAGYVRKYLRL